MDQTQLLARLRASADLTDEDVALLTAAYIERFTDLAVNDTSIVCGMLMFAARRVTQERAEHLLSNLESTGLVEDFDSPMSTPSDPA